MEHFVPVSYPFSLPMRWQSVSRTNGLQYLDMECVGFQSPICINMGQELNVPLMKDVDFEAQWPKQQLHFFSQSYYNSQTRLFFFIYILISLVWSITTENWSSRDRAKCSWFLDSTKLQPNQTSSKPNFQNEFSLVQSGRLRVTTEVSIWWVLRNNAVAPMAISDEKVSAGLLHLHGPHYERLALLSFIQ